MTNTGVSNERRKELAQNDPFQEFLLKTMGYAKANAKMLGLMAGAVVVVVVIFSTIIVGFQKSENTAATLYGMVLRQYQMEATDPVKAHGAVKADMAVLMDEYANTSAGRMALVKFGRISLDAGKYDQAETYFKKALDELKNEAGLENFILSSLGHVKLAQKDDAGAKTWFTKVLESDSDLLKDEARFILAGLAEKANDSAGARKLYQGLLENNENSIFTQIAEGKVALLD